MKRSVKVALGVFFILSLASLFVGALDLNLRALIQGNPEAWHVFLVSRLPRYIAVVLCGVSLSIAGLLMQKMSNNRFVSPSTAVTFDAARLGTLVAMLWFPMAQFIPKSLFAFTFALVGTGMFLFVMQKIQFKNVIFVPLVGMMLGLVIEGITTFIALKYDLMQALGGMMSGSFAYVLQGRYEILFISVPLIVISIIYAKHFDIVSLGEDFAHNLGVKYKRVLLLGVIVVSLLSASVVVTIGTIPFVGLIVPNIVTQKYGDDHRNALPLSALYGALLLLASDLLARILIAPYELPVSFIVAIVGAGVFLKMLLGDEPHEA